MRCVLFILVLSACTVLAGGVRGQTARTSSLEGVVTLVDAHRKLLVIQNGEKARAIKFESGLPRVELGERIRVEGEFAPYFGVFPAYPAHPSGSKVLPAFQAPTDWKDNFIARVRGHLRAPADGDYTFWIAADDEGELFLGSNSDMATARLIASVPQATSRNVWDRYPQQKSQPVFLKAGENYYIEALQRQWRGHNHLAVAWQGPGFKRQVIGGQYLTPWRSDVRATNGILYEYWTNCFITRLAMLSPQFQDPSMVRVSGARVKLLGQGQLPPARRMSFDELQSGMWDYTWSEVEGTVNFIAADDGVLTLDLNELNGRTAGADTRMVVHVLNWGNHSVANLMNRKVRAYGVCERMLDSQGQPDGGILWVQDQDRLSLLNFADRDSEGLQPVPMFKLSPANLNLTWGRKILLRGMVMSYNQETGMALLRGDDTFYAYSSSDGKTWTQFGTPVSVAMNDSILAGLMASSLTATQGTVARFDGVSEDTGRSKLMGLDGGSAPGTMALSNRTVILRPAGGNDMISRDQGMFFCQPLQGERDFVAHLESFKPTRISDVAGLMMRRSTNADAPYVALVMTHSTRLDLLYRPSRGTIAKAVQRNASQVPTWLKLVRRRHTFTAQLMHGQTLHVHQPVELVGLLNWANGQPMLADAYVRPATGNAEPVPVDDVPRVVQIADLPSAPAGSDQYLNQDYLLRGVVTFMGRAFGREVLFLQDNSGATLMRASPFVFQSERIKPGRLLEVEGGVLFSPGVPPFRVSTATVLGRGALPHPRPYPDRSEAKAANSHWVEAHGIVRSVTNNIMRVMGQDGPVQMWVGDLSSPQALARYVDCLITVEGVFSLQVAPEPALLVPSPRFIEVTESAPKDPFIIPSHSIDRVSASDLNLNLLHRIKVTGVVTYRGKRLLVIQDQTGGAQVQGAATSDLHVGDLVEAVGFPDLESGTLTLRESAVRKIGEGESPEPIKMMMEGILDGRLNCWLVRLAGIVLDQKSRQGQQMIELQNGRRVFQAVLADSAGHLKPLADGSRVQVTGVTQLQVASRSSGVANGRDLPIVATMDVLMRTPDDLMVLQRPPWWTWRRAAFAGALLLGLLAGAFGWIHSLRQRVAKRTSELENAMGRLQKETELSATLAERERLAAEIHDTLEQGLSGIMMQLDGADTRLANDTSGARENLEMARRMVKFSRAEVRHSLWNLESDLLKDKDLGGAITELARQMGVGSATVISVEVSGARLPLPASIEHHLLRCTQEGISNALKHSGAKTIRVQLNFMENSVELAVTDDGGGFDSSQVLSGPGTHLGLRNLRSRTRKMKGRLDISSEPRKGTTVHLTVPFNGMREKAPASTQ